MYVRNSVRMSERPEAEEWPGRGLDGSLAVACDMALADFGNVRSEKSIPIPALCLVRRSADQQLTAFHSWPPPHPCALHQQHCTVTAFVTSDSTTATTWTMYNWFQAHSL